MPATEAERSRLRNDLGVDASVLPDAEVDELLDFAAEVHPDYSRTVQYLWARMSAAKRMAASYATRVTYQQNDSRESLSDITKAFLALANTYKTDLVEAIAEEDAANELPPVQWGSMRKVPRTRRDRP